MKKILLVAVVAAFSYLGATAQTAPGNSAYGHSHKKIHRHYHHVVTTHREDADRKPINVEHRTTIRTIKHNDELTNRQSRDQVREANVTHRVEMKTETRGKREGRDKK